MTDIPSPVTFLQFFPSKHQTSHRGHHIFNPERKAPIWTPERRTRSLVPISRYLLITSSPCSTHPATNVLTDEQLNSVSSQTLALHKSSTKTNLEKQHCNAMQGMLTTTLSCGEEAQHTGIQEYASRRDRAYEYRMPPYLYYTYCTCRWRLENHPFCHLSVSTVANRYILSLINSSDCLQRLSNFSTFYS